MNEYYNAVDNRIVSSANYNVYVNGSLHPDRVMQEHDFVYILSGSWEIYQDGNPYMLFADDVILLRAGKHHYGMRPCTSHTKTMYIHVNSLKSDCADSETALNLDTVIHCQNNLKVKQLFQDIISAFWSKSPQNKIRLSHVWGLMLCEMKECLEHPTQGSDRETTEITQLFQQTPQVFYSAKELAKKYFVCEKTLNNKFKRIYNKSIYKYQMDTKLEAVCLFLRDHPDIKLREAAVNFGFYDEFHLSKTFKKKFGLSPRQFQKSY